MKSKLRQWWLPLTAVLLAVTTLSGCALSPGSNIDYDAEGSPLEGHVEVVPITMQLVREQSRQPLYSLDDVAELYGENKTLAEYEYRIGRGDVLSVIVYDHPELTIPAGSERSATESGQVVHPEGTIFYPYIGKIKVAGRTVRDVRDEIQRRLGGYIAQPQVDVRVAAFNSQKVYVTGQVNEPGPYPITNIPMRVLDAISYAAGLNDSASWHNAVLTRNGQDIRISIYDMLTYGELEQNLLLQDGDVLHIPDAGNQKVFVMGEVNEPTTLPLLNSPISLTDAIALAGGIDEGRANASGIFVIRRNPDISDSDTLATIYQLDASNAAAFILGAQFMLQPTDVIYVTAAPAARWNRVLSLLLPSLTTVFQATEISENVQNLSD
ncbi:polysaccharide export protein [Halomonas sp. WWR20]